MSLASALLEIPAEHDGAPRARKRALLVNAAYLFGSPIPAAELSMVLSAR